MNFVARIVEFLVSDALVKKLANSKNFQKFALKTHTMSKDLGKNLAEGTEVAKKTIQEQAKVVNKNNTNEGFSVSTFLAEFTNEIMGEEEKNKPKKTKQIPNKKSSTY